MTKYISQTDTAKIIRKELKTNFPGVKFSVRCDYSTIRVRWTDGPSVRSVEKVTKFFEGATFDSMVDCKYYKDTTWNGEEVHFSCDYVMTDRTMTRPFVQAIVNAFCNQWGYTSEQIIIKGNEEASWVSTRLAYNDEQHLQQLLHYTDAKDAHRPYEAEEEYQQAKRQEWERNEPQRRAQAEKERQERAQAEEMRRQQEAKREQERQESDRRQREQATCIRREIFTNREQALAYLGLSIFSSDTMINATFRTRVKNASDGRGGYTEDMDRLVKAKEKALQR